MRYPFAQQGEISLVDVLQHVHAIVRRGVMRGNGAPVFERPADVPSMLPNAAAAAPPQQSRHQGTAMPRAGHAQSAIMLQQAMSGLPSVGTDGALSVATPRHGPLPASRHSNVTASNHGQCLSSC